jgi:PAS domain-containing protein
VCSAAAAAKLTPSGIFERRGIALADSRPGLGQAIVARLDQQRQQATSDDACAAVDEDLASGVRSRRMVGRRQKNLVLILAREFASKLATATFVTDAAGDLVYYNEAAEELLGRPFGEVGEVRAEEWGSLFSVADLDGTPVPLEEMPGGVALLERRPTHRVLRITGLDGVPREISITALPLFAHADELVGTIAVFWQPANDRQPR